MYSKTTNRSKPIIVVVSISNIYYYKYILFCQYFLLLFYFELYLAYYNLCKFVHNMYCIEKFSYV